MLTHPAISNESPNTHKQENNTAKSSASANKSVAKGGGDSCALYDIACAKCSTPKGKGGSACLACSTNGPIPAELNDLGRCVCPPGSARFGSPNTVNIPLGGAAKVSNSGSAKAAGKGKVDIACALCDEDTYSTIARPVAISKCTPCPSGTISSTQFGGVACEVLTGQWFNVATQAAEACPVGYWCGGGNIANVGKVRTPCPLKSTTAGFGSPGPSYCYAAPGTFYDPGTDTVKECPQNYYCAGGSVTNPATAVPTPCPGKTTTASTGASVIDQCVVQPGFLWSGGAIEICPSAFPGRYCLGGSITGQGAGSLECPNFTCSNPGTARIVDCFPCS